MVPPRFHKHFHRFGLPGSHQTFPVPCRSSSFPAVSSSSTMPEIAWGVQMLERNPLASRCLYVALRSALDGFWVMAITTCLRECMCFVAHYSSGMQHSVASLSVIVHPAHAHTVTNSASRSTNISISLTVVHLSRNHQSFVNNLLLLSQTDGQVPQVGLPLWSPDAASLG